MRRFYEQIKTLFLSWKYLKKYFINELNSLTAARLTNKQLSGFSHKINNIEISDNQLEKYKNWCEGKIKIKGGMEEFLNSKVKK
jgi:hypothetical protein